MEDKKEIIEEVSQNDTGEKQREFRGLYKHVKISVKTLDIIKMNDLFDVLVGLDDVSEGKPSKEGIEKALSIYEHVNHDRV